MRAGDETAAGRQRLAEHADPQVHVGLDAEQLACTRAASPQHTGGVRLVDHQPRAVGLAQLDDSRQRGDVALHC